MFSKITPTEVRQVVVEYMSRFAAEATDDAVIETLLVRDGRYYGRSYRVAGFMAMWMIEIGLIQIYSADGDMLATLSTLEPADAPRFGKAA